MIYYGPALLVKTACPNLILKRFDRFVYKPKNHLYKQQSRSDRNEINGIKPAE